MSNETLEHRACTLWRNVHQEEPKDRREAWRVVKLTLWGMADAYRDFDRKDMAEDAAFLGWLATERASEEATA
jgi:hypothetical protein